MDFTIDKADLLAAVSKCMLAVPDPKHPTEAFRVMRVDATRKKKSAAFIAVGEACSVDTVAPSENKESGAFNVIPAHLDNVAHSMPPGKIRFTMKGTRVTVQSVTSKRKASFESHSIDIKPVDDPGKEAAWQEVDAEELVKGLQAVKAASVWYSRSDPVASLLIPTPRGLDLFGCNMYLIALKETSIRMEGKPIILPAVASSVLPLMAAIDANVKIYADDRRVYLENADTLVSASLFAYPFEQNWEHMVSLFKDVAAVGPTIKLPRLTEGVKSLLRLNGFAGASERNDFGFRLRMDFAGTVAMQLDLAAADGRDEFDVEKTGAEFGCVVQTKLFESLLNSSFAGVEDAQIAYSENGPTKLLIIRSKGITTGIMTAKETP